MQNNIIFVLIFIFFLTASLEEKGAIASTNFQKETKNTSIEDSTILSTGWYYIEYKDSTFKRKLDKSDKIYLINPKPIIKAKNITTLEIYESNPITTGQSYLGLGMIFDKYGTKEWETATEKSIGKELGFILDNKLMIVAIVNLRINDGMAALNRGVYTRQELEDIKKKIESEK